MKIKVKDVKEVAGNALRGNWRSRMIVITAEDNTVYIDNLPGKKHSNNSKAWYGYDNWDNLKGQEIEIEITDEWGNNQTDTSAIARYDIWAKHPDVKMVK